MITHKLVVYIERTKHKIYTVAMSLLQKESSHKKLILSCCVGVYIAISPFIFLHTVMTVLFGWLFALNIPVMFTVSWCINNPWTMIPIYTFDCVMGNWIFTLVGIDSMQCNPCWMANINTFLADYLGITGISFWAFMVGGNLFALALSGILYPLFSYFFIKIRR
jgi:uncharacterized protein (DUF2062 family)